MLAGPEKSGLTCEESHGQFQSKQSGDANVCGMCQTVDAVGVDATSLSCPVLHHHVYHHTSSFCLLIPSLSGHR